MIRQPGPYMVPGNATAARRLGRKPPRIILWSIGIITCLLFAGAAAMLAIGYLNAFGTVGLSILGVGAVAYFGGIIFLVLSCLWVERKYPGMQPLSFRIYSRKPHRPPPTVFMNPNVSGQIPSDTTQGYRIQDLPSNITGVSDVERGMDNIPSDSKDTEENIKDDRNENKLPKPRYSVDPDNLPTIMESLKDDNSKMANRSEAIKHDETSAHVTDKSSRSFGNVAIKGQPQIQQEHLSIMTDIPTDTTVQNEKDFHHNQQENNIVPSSNTQMERKAQRKTHHIEIPPEDYLSPANSTSTHNNTKEPQPQDVSPHSSKSTENNSSDNSGDLAIVTYTEEKTSKLQKRNTNKKQVSFQTPSTDQKSTEHNLSIINQTQQNSSHPSNTEKERSSEKEIKVQNPSQTTNIQKLSGAQMKKQIQAHPSKSTNKNSQKNVTASTSGDSFGFIADSQGNLPSLAKTLGSRERLKKRKSLEKAKKPDSPEIEIQSRHDHQSLQSSPNSRKIVSSSSPLGYNQRIADSSPKVTKTKDNSVAMTSIPSNNESLYKIPLSESTGSSSNLSSPTSQQTRSPEASPKVSKHHILS